MATSILPGAAFTQDLPPLDPLQQYGLLLPSLETRASAAGADPSFNTSSILARRQQHQIQIIAATFSSVSVLTALCALYWFCTMRRNFRRDLVLLLIIGDFWKSLWFLIGSAATLAEGQVLTESPFCQASGYFLQVGAEACDLSIFLMSLHMLLQIFPPSNSILGQDGLYRIRYWVLAGWVIVPNVIVSLAFINSASAFIAQGGFCTLPIRPFWYRLALSWVPRYLIWLFVMGVAIRIYMHVGYEFKVFGMEQDQSSTSGIGITNSKDTQSSQTGRLAAAMQWSQSSRSDGADAEKQSPRDEDIAPDEDITIPALPRKPSPVSMSMFDFKRRQSVPNWPTAFGGSAYGRGESSGQPLRPVSKSNPGSRRGSKQMAPGVPVNTEDFALLPPITSYQRHGSSASTAASVESAQSDMPLAALSPITEHRSTSITQAQTLMQEDNAATRAIAQRRRAIQRQLRLLFIYPVVYLIMWCLPFVAHAMNYSNYYAQHPIFAISALSIFAQCIMGTVDVCVFCWREKPWAHVPGADGTFWGSFKIWKFGGSWEHRRSSAHPASFMHQTDAKVDSTTGFLTSIKRWSESKSSKSSQMQDETSRKISAPQTPPPARRIQHLRINSGRSDRRVMDAERAQERLALERAEFSHRHMKGLQSRQGSEPSEQVPLSPPSREWWDRHMSLGDLDDHIMQKDNE